MKKILALLLAAMMVFALCACGGNSSAPAAEEAAAPAGEEKTVTVEGFAEEPVIVTATIENNTITALTIDASTQTAGLGQLASEEAFTSQFIGKTLPVALGDGIDAIASATITSTAVVNALNSLAD